MVRLRRESAWPFRESGKPTTERRVAGLWRDIRREKWRGQDSEGSRQPMIPKRTQVWNWPWLLQINGLFYYKGGIAYILPLQIVSFQKVERPRSLRGPGEEKGNSADSLAHVWRFQPALDVIKHRPRFYAEWILLSTNHLCQAHTENPHIVDRQKRRRE
jgi:hypothetical protein